MLNPCIKRFWTTLDKISILWSFMHWIHIGSFTLRSEWFTSSTFHHTTLTFVVLSSNLDMILNCWHKYKLHLWPLNNVAQPSLFTHLFNEGTYVNISYCSKWLDAYNHIKSAFELRWAEVEHESGIKLVHKTGSLDIAVKGTSGMDTLQSYAKAMDDSNIQ